MKQSKLPIFRCFGVWRSLVWLVLVMFLLLGGVPVLEAADQLPGDRNKGERGPHHGRPGKSGKPGKPGMGGHDFQALDKDGDGFLSFEEFSQSERLSRIDEEKRRKLFDFLDRNKEGKLHMRELRPTPPHWMPALHKEFDLLDVDQSGGLDFAEFSKVSQLSKIEELERRKIFSRLDRNGDKAIRRDELRGPGSKGGKGGGGGGGARKGSPNIDLKKHDINQSGGLDFDEYSTLPWMSRIPVERRKMIFIKLDRDKNGEISPEEVKSACSDRRKDGKSPYTRPHPHRERPLGNGGKARL